MWIWISKVLNVSNVFRPHHWAFYLLWLEKQRQLFIPLPVDLLQTSWSCVLVFVLKQLGFWTFLMFIQDHDPNRVPHSVSPQKFNFKDVKIAGLWSAETEWRIWGTFLWTPGRCSWRSFADEREHQTDTSWASCPVELNFNMYLFIDLVKMIFSSANKNVNKKKKYNLYQ